MTTQSTLLTYYINTNVDEKSAHVWETISLESGLVWIVRSLHRDKFDSSLCH